METRWFLYTCFYTIKCHYIFKIASKNVKMLTKLGTSKQNGFSLLVFISTVTISTNTRQKTKLDASKQDMFLYR